MIINILYMFKRMVFNEKMDLNGLAMLYETISWCLAAITIKFLVWGF